MRIGLLAITILIGLTACFQTENSSSQDKDTYGNIGGSAEFLAVRTILTNYCASCHAYHTLSEADMKLGGCAGGPCIVAGSPDTSQIYCRLTGAAGSCTVGSGKNMPQGSGGLSSSDLNAIRFWIVNAPP